MITKGYYVYNVEENDPENKKYTYVLPFAFFSLPATDTFLELGHQIEEKAYEW